MELNFVSLTMQFEAKNDPSSAISAQIGDLMKVLRARWEAIFMTYCTASIFNVRFYTSKAFKIKICETWKINLMPKHFNL